MTRRAFGAKWGALGASGSLESAARAGDRAADSARSVASALLPTPTPQSGRRWRRLSWAGSGQGRGRGLRCRRIGGGSRRGQAAAGLASSRIVTDPPPARQPWERLTGRERTQAAAAYLP